MGHGHRCCFSLLDWSLKTLRTDMRSGLSLLGRGDWGSTCPRWPWSRRKSLHQPASLREGWSRIPLTHMVTLDLQQAQSMIMKSFCVQLWDLGLTWSHGTALTFLTLVSYEHWRYWYWSPVEWSLEVDQLSGKGEEMQGTFILGRRKSPNHQLQEFGLQYLTGP